MLFRTKIFGLLVTSLVGWLQAPPVLGQQVTKLKCNVTAMLQGSSVAISADAGTILAGAPGLSGLRGGVCVWSLKGNEWIQQQDLLVGADATSSQVSFEKQGNSVALSADGNTGIVGDLKGSAWVWTRDHGVWSQQGSRLVEKSLLYWVQSNNITFVDSSVAISSDGNTAIVGYFEVGSVWVWTRAGGTWSEQAKLAGPGVSETDGGACGRSVALSADGNTASATCLGDDGGKGAVRVWTRNSDAWLQQGPPLAGSGAIGNPFRSLVALAANGNTLLVGGSHDNDNVGAVWVWTRTAGAWSQQGPKLVGTGAVGKAFQGASVALSSDGNIALVGGPIDSTSTGAAWVWARDGVQWTQVSKLQGRKAFSNHASSQGWSVALSPDGRVAVVGGPNDGVADDGAVWVYTIDEFRPTKSK
jgi:WD40 repeat protein